MADPASTLSLPADDVTIVFRTDASRVHGRLVRLGPVADKIINGHGLPTAAAQLLGQGLALAGLLGSALQQRGSISLQTQTDGPVPQIYAECEAPGKLRGYARADLERPCDGAASSRPGCGHLAFTIDHGTGGDRYQGVIGLDGQTLAEAACAYFEQRESLPSFLRLAVAERFVSTSEAEKPRGQWRCGGLMLQPLGDVRLDEAADDEGWARVRMLAQTVEDHELLDPMLTAERLLIRLFHEEGVTIEKTVLHSAYCKCSREKILTVLRTFGSAELDDLKDGAGHVDVTCEFCGASYRIETDVKGLR